MGFPTECRFVCCLPEFLHFQVCWLIYQTLCVWSSSRMETLIQTQGWWCRRKPAVTWSGEAKYVSDMYHIDNRIQNSNFTTQTENSSQFYLNTSQTWGQICIRYVSHSNIIHILKKNSPPEKFCFQKTKSNMYQICIAMKTEFHIQALVVEYKDPHGGDKCVSER